MAAQAEHAEHTRRWVESRVGKWERGAGGTVIRAVLATHSPSMSTAFGPHATQILGCVRIRRGLQEGSAWVRRTPTTSHALASTGLTMPSTPRRMHAAGDAVRTPPVVSLCTSTMQRALQGPQSALSCQNTGGHSAEWHRAVVEGRSEGVTSPAHRSGDTTTAWPCEDTQCTSRVWKPVVGTPQGVLHADQRDACNGGQRGT